MSHNAFWIKVVEATRHLWKISSEAPQFWYMVDILDFMENRMDLNFRMQSFLNPVTFEINDMADPETDLPRLIDFIKAKCKIWKHNDYCLLYLRELEQLLGNYMLESNLCQVSIYKKGG